MSEQVKPEGPDVAESSEAHGGGPEFQRTPGKAEGEDPQAAESQPQGTLIDPEDNMEAERRPVTGDAPRSPMRR